MSNKQETIADIVAAMRNEGHAGDESCLEWVGAKIRGYADRIEAAHQREVAEMSDTIIIRRNGEKFAVDCSTVLEAFNGHLKVKFDGIICPKCGASDSCWIPVRKVEDDGDRTVKLYEVDFKDGYSMVIMGRRKPTIDEANAFLSEDINRMKCGSVVNVTNEISEEDARKFYDFTNHKNWVIFPMEGAK